MWFFTINLKKYIFEVVSISRNYLFYMPLKMTPKGIYFIRDIPESSIRCTTYKIIEEKEFCYLKISTTVHICNLFLNEVMVHRCPISQKIVDYFFINVFSNTSFPEQILIVRFWAWPAPRMSPERGVYNLRWEKIVFSKNIDFLATIFWIL